MTIETRDTPIRRRPDGSIDTDHYLNAARSARVARQRSVFAAFCRTLAGWRRRGKSGVCTPQAWAQRANGRR